MLPLTSQGQARDWTCLEIPSLSLGSWKIPLSQLQVLFVCSKGSPVHSKPDVPLKNSFDGHYTAPHGSQAGRREQRRQDAPPVLGVGGLRVQRCLFSLLRAQTWDILSRTSSGAHRLSLQHILKLTVLWVLNLVPVLLRDLFTGTFSLSYPLRCSMGL